MIKYVQNKKTDYARVEQLLNKSAKLCRFSNGGPVKFELENKIAQILNLSTEKAVLCVNSGTSAIHALMFFFESQTTEPFKWGTIAYNFPCPVVNKFDCQIFDIEANDHTYSIVLDEELKSCDGFVLPTLFGTLPNNFEACISFCNDHNIKLILDNASSPLSRYNNINICAFGDASIGSLHHTKYLGFGEGGFLVVDKKYLLEIESLTNFGFFQNRKHKNLSSNFKMSDVSAAFILAHVENYDIEKHIKVQKKFIDALNIFNYSEDCVYGNLPVVFNKPVSQLSFRDYGIEANKYYVPLKSMPSSDRLYERMINFPLHQDLSDYEINKIIEQIELAL